MTAEHERNWVTLTIDGREVQAREGEWLLEAAKRGDVEIPYFCYERKLGPPVGACRMCLVEIEGIPKLQVSCATPVMDGMIVNTLSDRVKEAQNAVVEFLLVNHPLDCPVCDKGGECPLQDISYGWGPGRSRFVEPKRNFPKPIALSPLVAIDRERCILCYRCVRFSQEVSEDYQLTFLQRADHTFVGTFDGHPYVAPFAGNVIELCPVGALTSTAYRFRARPWEIEDAGSICTLCPSQCNVRLTVRDERVERVLARDNEDVDDGWLCDKGRFGYQSIHSPERILEPLVRDGGLLRPASWEEALDAAAEGMRAAGTASAALAGGAATNDEGYLLQRIFREALGSGNVDSRGNGPLEADTARLLAHPELSARLNDLDRAAVVLVIGADPINEAPIVDLRVRKAVRRFGAKLIVAASQPTALDGGAAERLWLAPGGEEALLRALQKAMLEVDQATPPPARAQSGPASEGASRPGEAAPAQEGTGRALAGQRELLEFLDTRSVERLAQTAGAEVGDLRDAARLLVGAQSMVILWGERLGTGARGPGALRALLDLALLAGVDGDEGSGLLEIPSQANARGLREVGLVSTLGPGLSELDPGLSAAEARDAAVRGELEAFYLLETDPLREYSEAQEWERALSAARFVVAHAQFRSECIERHAEVVFPAEAHAEKEGTVTHPDGRLQRLRPAIGHPGQVRSGRQVLAELGRRLGLSLPSSSRDVFGQLSEAVALYEGVTLDDIGGQGMRWQEWPASLDATRGLLPELRFSAPADPPPLPEAPDQALRLCLVPNLWASWVTEHSPALDFLRVNQELQLHPADAERLGLAQGTEVDVNCNGHSVRAPVRLRSGAMQGCAYLVEGTAQQNANLLSNGKPLVVELRAVAEA